MFLNTYRRLRETGNTYYRREHNILRAENVELDENAVRAQPSISTRRLAYQSHTLRRQVLRVLHGENVYPYYSTPVQGLLPEDFLQRLQFCNWLLYESQFTRNGITNFHNLHTWVEENPHQISKHHFSTALV